MGATSAGGGGSERVATMRSIEGAPVGLTLAILALLISAVGTYVFATLAYSLRDFSRAELGAWLERRNRQGRLESILASAPELALTAAVTRAACNLVLILAIFHLVARALPDLPLLWLYLITFGVGVIFVGLVGVALPLATAEHAAEPFIGLCSGIFPLKRIVLFPVVALHAPLDSLVRRVTGHGPAGDPEEVEEELEKEILEIVQEGRAEGVIDDAEREMIERAIRFQDATAGQAMTARPDVVGLSLDAEADEVLRVIDETGYSRIPVYDGTLDKVVGVLYARDLFRFVGKRVNGRTSESGDTQKFVVPDIMRPPLIVPETKPLADLLRDMQYQKVHMAIVLDEYGGTAGVVTIEDVLEELVGEIADEHEEDEVPMFERVDETHAEADARLSVEEVNRLLGLGLPEEHGFDTLGGFVTTTLGQIPQAGTSFEHEGERVQAVFTVLDAEPQRVNRIAIEFHPRENEPRKVAEADSAAGVGEDEKAAASAVTSGQDSD